MAGGYKSTSLHCFGIKYGREKFLELMYFWNNVDYFFTVKMGQVGLVYGSLSETNYQQNIFRVTTNPIKNMTPRNLA